MQKNQVTTTSEGECNVSFRDYLFKDKTNKRILIGAGIVSVVLFSVFKYFYPFASYIHGDSFSYLHAAYENFRVSTYMIGYSMFLRLVSVFTVSDIVLVGIQYFTLQASSLLLLFTLFYFYRPGKITRWILISFILFNPLFPFIGNMVSSDALFLMLSLTWFSLLIWIINKPSLRLIFWHTLVIYIVFTVRYNALIYLFISAAAFIISSQALWKKMLGIGAGALAIFLFIVYTGNQYKELTGRWQYSPFAGWQIANNAMDAYRWVDSAERKPVPLRFRVLDNMVREYYDTTKNFFKYPYELLLANTVYMWDSRSPLYIYRNQLYKLDTTTSELKKWASMGPLYKDYGWYIIRQYPTQFAQFFLWPNSTKYYAPPVEFLSTYNSGKDSVAPVAMAWFHYTSQKVFTRTKSFKIEVLNFYPIMSGAANIAMLFGMLCFFLLNGFRQTSRLKNVIALTGTFWILNAAFTIFASSAALRFQSFPILLTTITVFMLVDWIWQIAFSSESKIKNADIKVAQKETLAI